MKGADLMSKRTRSKAYTMGAVDHAVQTAMDVTSKRLEKTEGRLDHVEAQHEECERNLAIVRADLATEKLERAELQANIDRLMSGGPALYGQKAPVDG